MGEDFVKTNTSDKMCQHNPSHRRNWCLRMWDYFWHGSTLVNYETYTASCSRCGMLLQAPEALWLGRFAAKVVALLLAHASIYLTWIYRNTMGNDMTYYPVPQGIGADTFFFGTSALFVATVVGCWLVPRIIVSLIMALGKWIAVDLQETTRADYLVERCVYTKQHKRQEFYRFLILFCVTSWLLVIVLKVLRVLF